MLNKLIELSNYYGSNPDYVLAGGGNTSYKADGVIYVKASGFKLADIDSSGFVAMDMGKLKAITKKAYPGDEKSAEAQVLSDMMESRLPEQTGRPSVEALLHALFPQSFVVHLHPAALNGLTCSKNGKAELERLLGESAAWLDEIKPGYTLAMASLRAMEDYRAKTGRDLAVLVMQNHGIFFAAQSAPEIEALISDVFGKIEGAIKKRPDMAQAQTDTALAAALAPAIRELVCPGGSVCIFSPAALPEFVGGTDGTLCAFTPDHIVYCGHAFCRVGACVDLEQLYGGLQAAIKEYKENEGTAPKIVCVDGLGAFACGASARDAATAKALFCDAIKVFCFAQSFGGHRLMERAMIDFIRSWEVESYRKKVASQGGTAKKLTGKTVVITGGAQGFGAGLARFVCSEGANTVIADINEKGAAEFAAELNAAYGEGAAAAVGCDVADEESVRELCERACLVYGGIDVFISNAGILRSGGLEDMDFKAFELMTRVNYSAFFLCSKYASRAMKISHRFSPGKYFDIIQINSKSGLSGSNKNFAYAGGKFGGIGLVQSFALELVTYNIKVNAICPGNFLDGPLWTDPEKGLFVQYLRAGKVPGAKTPEDVRRAYEAKVPMNRGCEVKDVARALIYAIEQEYETGQAIPVTGGQNMLK